MSDSMSEPNKMIDFLLAMIPYSVKIFLNKYPLEHAVVTMLYQVGRQIMHVVWESGSVALRGPLLHGHLQEKEQIIKIPSVLSPMTICKNHSPHPIPPTSNPSCSLYGPHFPFSPYHAFQTITTNQLEATQRWATIS